MSMQVRALARVVMSPLVDTLPCLGAVQISLLEEPHIDFSISLFGSPDLMLLPILKDAVNFAAMKVCAHSAVLVPTCLSGSSRSLWGGPCSQYRCTEA